MYVFTVLYCFYYNFFKYGYFFCSHPNRQCAQRFEWWIIARNMILAMRLWTTGDDASLAHTSHNQNSAWIKYVVIIAAHRHIMLGLPAPEVELSIYIYMIFVIADKPYARSMDILLNMLSQWLKRWALNMFVIIINLKNLHSSISHFQLSIQRATSS